MADPRLRFLFFWGFFYVPVDSADAVRCAIRLPGSVGDPAAAADDDNAKVGAYWARQVETAAYTRMRPQRERLPAYKMRRQLIETVMGGRSQVTVISGETGCGKTTQVQ